MAHASRSCDLAGQLNGLLHENPGKAERPPLAAEPTRAQINEALQHSGYPRANVEKLSTPDAVKLHEISEEITDTRREAREARAAGDETKAKDLEKAADEAEKHSQKTLGECL